MFKCFKNLIKKKGYSTDLEKAFSFGYITEEEFLELKVNRAMAEFEEFKKKNKQKK